VKDEGKFWMEFKDFEEIYRETNVGYYLDDYKQTRVQGNLKRDKKTAFTVLNNPVKQHVFLQVDTTQWRQYMNDCKAESRVNDGEEFNFKMNKDSMYLDWNNYADTAFMEWKELPAGSYDIEASSWYSGSGSLPYSFVAHASKQAVEMFGV